MKKDKYQIAIKLGKYLPIIVAFIMLIHVIMLCLGADERVGENMLVLLFAVMLYCYDRALNFCLLHRLLGVYGVAIDWCINFQRHVGFGSMLVPMRYVMLSVGIILFTLLIRQTLCKKR